jgi:O-antigen/teichoic acid export membrane protein
MDKLRRTGINMISGGAGFILPMAINFLATPLLLEKLGKEAYGLQSLVNVILGYLMVADMGLDIPITKFLAEFNVKKDFTNRDSLLSNTFQLYILIGILGMVIILILEPYLHSLFHIPDFLKSEAKIVFWITGVGFLGNILSMWGKAVFIGMHRYDIANGVYTILSLISTVAGIVMVYQGMGLTYFVLARVTGFFLSSFAYMIFLKIMFVNYRLSAGFEKQMINRIRPLIGYGFILRLSGMVFSRLDQSLLSAWVGIAAVGIYSIPYLITMAISGLIYGIMNFTFPKASELYSTNRKDELNTLFIRSTKLTTVIASFFFSFLLAAGDRFVYVWIDPVFASQAQMPLLILSVAYYISVISVAILNNFLVAMNSMRFFTLYSILKSSAMGIGFLTMIKPLGLAGAALGVLVGSICDIIYLFVSLKNHLMIKFETIVMQCYLQPILIGALSGIALYSQKMLISDWGSLILCGLGYSALFLLLGISLKVFGAREKQMVIKILGELKLLK